MTVTWTPTFGDAQNIGFGSSTYTTPTETFGNGYAVIWLWNDNQGPGPLTGVTICGQTATLLAQGTGFSIRMFCYGAVVNSPTGVVQATSSGVFACVASNGGIFTGADPSTVTVARNSSAITADPQSLTITIPTGGVCAVGVGSESSTSSPTTWGNATQDAVRVASVATGNTSGVDGANNSTAGSQTITATGSGSNGWGHANDNMFAVALGPLSSGGDNLVGEMPMIQMKRKSLGWVPPLVDHRRRQWRRNRSLLVPSNKLWTPRRKMAA